MPTPRAIITDDGGPVDGRLGVIASPGAHSGERFAVVTIGFLQIGVAGVEESAAERCQAIAGAFHEAALALLRSTMPLDARAHAGDGDGAAREAGALTTTRSIGTLHETTPATYLGDGVYAAFDAATLNVILTTSDGRTNTNRIVLEPEVLDALGRFTQAAIHKRQAARS